jgi:hypothetical protein
MYKPGFGDAGSGWAVVNGVLIKISILFETNVRRAFAENA